MNNLIKKIKCWFKSDLREEDYERLLQKERLRLCRYTENPFSTDLRNFMLPIINSKPPIGLSFIKLTDEQVKYFLDRGICYLDYPYLNEDGTELSSSQ